MTEEKKVRTYTTPILVTLAVIVAFLAGMFVIKFLGGEKTGEQEGKAAQTSPTPAEETVLGEQLEPAGIGRFMRTKNEVCREDEKPIVYFFGRSSCPYCIWEHPIFEGATDKFVDLISIHNNMDNQGADREIWEEYGQISRNSVPFMILGCRYTQLGSGDQTLGEEVEERNITALICQLTEGEPEEVCEEVSDLIEEIKE